MIAGLRRELGPMLRLSAPLAMAELGWMAMGFVDTIMAGRIDAVSIGAGGVGHMLFFPIAISATGLLMGMDTLVAQAFGARDDDAVWALRILRGELLMSRGLRPARALVLQPLPNRLAESETEVRRLYILAICDEKLKAGEGRVRRTIDQASPKLCQ